MAQKAKLTPVDKYESDRLEAERRDREMHARLEAGLIDPVSAIQPAPTAEHQHREGLSFWQRSRRCSSRRGGTMRGGAPVHAGGFNLWIGFHSTSRITLRRLIRSSACTTSFLSNNFDTAAPRTD